MENNRRRFSSYNRSRNQFRGRGGRSRNKNSGSIDINKLIKKAAVTEVIETKYEPTNAFKDFKIAEVLKENIIRKGFTHPTPIQDQAIPFILDGKDVVGIANTGTGKTGAFLIPLLNKVYESKNQKVLIIAPTRELAEQINDELFLLTKNMSVYSVLCVGGMNIFPQMEKLRRPNQFVVGTPGRILDLINRRYIHPNEFQTIVLDEVDRMLDMGFINDIKKIIEMLPAVRHSLFFSATLKPEVERIMAMFVKDPVKVSVKTAETSDHVNQDVVYVSNHDEKRDKLEEFLAQPEFDKVIVFMRTKRGVEKLDDYLYSKGFKVESLHGNKTQGRRKRALDNFKRGIVKVLIATDVAARGLDVPNVTHVINYDMPATYEDYVHRIGRTGRASKTGSALTFVES